MYTTQSIHPSIKQSVNQSIRRSTQSSHTIQSSQITYHLSSRLRLRAQLRLLALPPVRRRWLRLPVARGLVLGCRCCCWILRLRRRGIEAVDAGLSCIAWCVCRLAKKKGWVKAVVPVGHTLHTTPPKGGTSRSQWTRFTLPTWYPADWSFLMLRLCRHTLISFPASPSGPGAVGITRAIPVCS